MTVKVSSELAAPGMEHNTTHPNEDEIRKRRAEMFERAEKLEAPQMDLSPSREDYKPHEDLESIEVQLPDGRNVVIGPPPGVSLTMRNAMMFGPETPNRLLSSMVRLMHCIRSIDGKSVPTINNLVDAQALANALGDTAIDLLFGVLADYWPALSQKDLVIVKKSARHSNSAR